MNKKANSIKNRKIHNDVIYTPEPLAKVMIDLCDIKPNDKVLDPSKGGGVFYDNLPECNKDYCEITEDKDFFEYDKEVDIIIGNPPYSIWTKWIEHTIQLNPKKFCYIFGQMNVTSTRLQNIFDAGYIVSKFHICKVDWWFGHSFVCIFEKGEKENSIISFTRESFYCDICKIKGSKKCMRGRTQTIKGVKKKWGMNECSNI
tara:strand:+ start:399 stop:1004 length:606 start_codon:yes stop_codon:yes gene_type:complete